MTVRTYLVVSSVLFGAVALLHLVRAVLGIPVAVGGASFPLSLSWAGAIVTGLLSAWGLRLAAGRPAG